MPVTPGEASRRPRCCCRRPRLPRRRPRWWPRGAECAGRSARGSPRASRLTCRRRSVSPRGRAPTPPGRAHRRGAHGDGPGVRPRTRSGAAHHPSSAASAPARRHSACSIVTPEQPGAPMLLPPPSGGSCGRGRPRAATRPGGIAAEVVVGDGPRWVSSATRPAGRRRTGRRLCASRAVSLPARAVSPGPARLRAGRRGGQDAGVVTRDRAAPGPWRRGCPRLSRRRPSAPRGHGP